MRLKSRKPVHLVRSCYNVSSSSDPCTHVHIHVHVGNPSTAGSEEWRLSEDERLYGVPHIPVLKLYVGSGAKVVRRTPQTLSLMQVAFYSTMGH